MSDVDLTFWQDGGLKFKFVKIHAKSRRDKDKAALPYKSKGWVIIDTYETWVYAGIMSRRDGYFCVMRKDIIVEPYHTKLARPTMREIDV